MILINNLKFMIINLTLASNSGALKFSVELYTYDTILQLKEELVSKEVLEHYGSDKLKLFQSGKHLDDSLQLSELSNLDILIFPTSPSLREIIYKKFSNQEKEEKKSNDKIQTEEVISVTPIKRQVSYQVLSEKPEEEVEEKPKEKQEEKVVLKTITQEELDKFNQEILHKFQSATFKTLLNLYYQDESSVLDFLRYLTGGSIKSINNELTISDDFVKEIQYTFPKARKMSLEELKVKLLEKGGNLNLLIQSGIIL
jgi:hypothetical protein